MPSHLISRFGSSFFVVTLTIERTTIRQTPGKEIYIVVDTFCGLGSVFKPCLYSIPKGLPISNLFRTSFCRKRQSNIRLQEVQVHPASQVVGAVPSNLTSSNRTQTKNGSTHFETAVILAIPRESVSTETDAAVATVFLKSFHSRTAVLV